MAYFRLFILCFALTGLTLGDPAPSVQPVKSAPKEAAQAQAGAPQEPAALVQKNRKLLGKLRENLKPVPTGDAWLDSILDEWSGFAFDSVGDVLNQFGVTAPKSKPAPEPNQ